MFLDISKVYEILKYEMEDKENRDFSFSLCISSKENKSFFIVSTRLIET